MAWCKSDTDAIMTIPECPYTSIVHRPNSNAASQALEQAGLQPTAEAHQPQRRLLQQYCRDHDLWSATPAFFLEKRTTSCSATVSATSTTTKIGWNPA